jgi:CARDB
VIAVCYPRIMNSLPDLAIKKFHADRSFVTIGAQVFFESTVANQGTEPVDSVEISFGRRKHHDTYNIGAIEAGKEKSFRIGPVSGSFGRYTYELKVDPAQKVRESDETNNQEHASFTVIDPTPPRDPWPRPRP